MSKQSGSSRGPKYRNVNLLKLGTRGKNRNMPHFFLFSLAKPAIPNDFQWKMSVTNYGYGTKELGLCD